MFRTWVISTKAAVGVQNGDGIVMNILLVSPSIQSVCGRSTMVLLLASTLHKRGNSVVLLTNPEGDRSIVDALPYEIRYTPINPEKKSLLTIAKSKVTGCNSMIPDGIDIIHTHHRYPAYLLGTCAAKLGIPHLTTVHSFVQGKESIRIQADRWIGVSGAVKQWLVSNNSIPESQIEVIYNGLEVPEPQVKTFPQNGIPFTVLAAGRFSREKGFDVLLEAWEKVVDISGHPVKLILAGEGTEETVYRKMIRGYESSVEIINGTGRMEELYDLAHLVVIPSREESLSYVLLEAGLRGIPVVCSNIGGMKELIEQNVSGVLVEPEHTDSFTEAIVIAIQRYITMNRYAETLRRNLMRQCTANSMTDAYITRYQQLLALRREK